MTIVVFINNSPKFICYLKNNWSYKLRNES